MLLLDEPLSNLDPLVRREVIGELLATVNDTGMTLLLSTHVITDLAGVADHLLLLAGGRLLIDGDVDELLARHLTYLGPRSDTPPGPGVVLTASHTERQSTFLVRLPDGTVPRPVTEPWLTKPVTLEQFVLAQLATSGGRRCFSRQLFGFQDVRGVADLQDGIAAALGLVAVFLAAPLLAREFEQRTNLLAWSQDVPPWRWLRSRAGWLVLAAAVLGAVLGTFLVGQADGLSGLKPDSYPEFTLLRFEAFLPLQIAYVLFGFALGLAASALLRRVVPAMGMTAVVFLGVRFGLSQFRPYYLTPVRSVAPLANFSMPYIGNSGLLLRFGMAGANGQPLDINNLACPRTVHSDATYLACLRSGGVVGQFVDFQPDYRLTAIRYIEVGIFLVLAAVLFGVVWLRMRRSTTIG